MLLLNDLWQAIGGIRQRGREAARKWAGRTPARPPFKRSPMFEALEQRMLMSADFAPIAPAGGLVSFSSQTGIIGTTETELGYTLSLDAGQKVSVGFSAQDPGLQASIRLVGADGGLLGAGSAAAPGEPVLLDSIFAPSAGDYNLVFHSLQGAGDFRADIFLNATVEAESFGGANNNDPASAQSLAPSELMLPGGALRYAAVGTTEAATADFYQLDLVAGETASFGLAARTPGTGASLRLELQDAAGTLLALGDGAATNFDQIISGFVVSAAGTYNLRVTGNGGEQYTLVALREARLDIEPNNSFDRAVRMDPLGEAIGNLGSGGGRINVAVVGGNTGDDSGLQSIVAQLNDSAAFDINAFFVTPSAVDTLPELAAYDVVVIGGTGYESNQFVAFAALLRPYVESGGGLITTGWGIYAATNLSEAVRSDFDAVVPVNAGAYNYFYYPTITPIGTHPIVEGLASFGGSEYVEYPYYEPRLDTGAIVLATVGSTPVAAALELGLGRSVYLGPIYAGAGEYDSSGLRSGEGDRLLEKAAVWASRGGTDAEDNYLIATNVGDSLVIATTTPGDGGLAPVNNLDPLLELYDPSGALVASNDNGAPDGRNALINYTVPAGAAGDYRVRVSPAAGSGDYTLQVQGASGVGADTLPFIVASKPAAGQVVGASTSKIDLTLSESIRADSISVSDLAIDGGASVSSVEFVNARLVRFSVELPNVTGTYSYSLSEGAFLDLQGLASTAFAASFDLDVTGPRVVAATPAGGANLPLDRISFTFDEAIDPASVGIDDVKSFTAPDGADIRFYLNYVDVSGDTVTFYFENQILAGVYTMVIGPGISDAYGNAMDQDLNGVGGQPGDVFTYNVILQLPDLVVTAIDAPTSARLADEISISWTVVNQGDGRAGDPDGESAWLDAIYLSQDTYFDPDVDSFLGQRWAYNHVPLDAGATYVETQTINVPAELASGLWYLLVVTDANSYQLESNEDNNLFAVPITLTTPDVDLVVSEITGPATLVLGETIDLSWTVTNQGSDPTNLAYWYDVVFYSVDSVLDANDVYLNYFYHYDALPGGGEYTQTGRIYIPTDFPGGSGYLLVATDYYAYQPETDEANNVRAVPITVVPPDIDLVVSQATVPATAQINSTVSVSWTVTNQGTTSAGASYWYDAVYLSADAVLDASDVYLRQDYHSGPLAAGASYTMAGNVYLPAGRGGAQYLLFATDYYNYQLESDETNNVRAVPISIGGPDLVASLATAPATAISGEQIMISFSVTNEGSAGTPLYSAWYDNVVLSEDTIFGNGDDVQLGYIYHSDHYYSPLDVGGTYVVNATLTIPVIGPGARYLLFAADGWNYLAETNDANNVVSLPITIETPDLTVSAATAPDTLIAGDTVQLTWTVSNIGNVTALADWYDSIYLSDDATFDSGDRHVRDFWMGDRSPLVGGASYTASELLQLPNVGVGARYILVVTDRYNYQGETDENNNVRAIPVTIVGGDLVVSAATAPASGVANGVVDVSWTVSNIGAVAAPADWYDYVFLSTDSVLDSSDHYLTAQWTYDSTPLAAGESYTRSARITLPNAAPGDRFLLFVADRDNYQGETDEANNVRAVPFRLDVPDLIVSAATAPSNSILGATIAVSWTITNDSAFDAAGNWYDSVFISPDPIYGNGNDTTLLNDYSIGRTPLAAGASYTLNHDLFIPNVGTGQRYLLFVADPYGYHVESNETNNVFVVPIALVATDLIVSTASVGVSAASIGETIDISWTVLNQGTTDAPADWYDYVYLSSNALLDGGDTFVASELIAAQTPLPAGASYTINRTVTVPNVAPGARYLLVAADGNGAQGETDETNNLFAVPFEVLAADLQVTGLGVEPSTPLSGRDLTVRWTDSNNGSGSTHHSWWDRVRIQNLTTGQTLVEVDVFFDRNVQGDIAAGTGLDRSFTYRLPNGTAGVGQLLVTVIGDIYNYLPEYNGGIAADANNMASITVESVLAAAPDLEVIGLAVSPAGPRSGDTLTITWSDVNNGSAAVTTNWRDRIVVRNLASGQTLLDTTLVRDVALEGPLKIGESRARQFSLVLPEGNAGTGELEITVITDSTNAIFELNTSGTAETNNTATVSVTATLGDYPDLQAVGLAIETGASLQSGAELTIRWNDVNSGNAAVATGWWDFVTLVNTTTGATLLSTSLFYDPNAPGNAPLAPGQQLVRQTQLTLPHGVAGAGNLAVSVRVDSYFGGGGSIVEFNTAGTGEANNTAALAATSALAAYADLVAVALVAPNSPVTGNPAVFDVIVTVENQGNGAISGAWTDRIFMSTDNIIGNGDDVLLAAFAESGPLAGGTGYTRTRSVTLPANLDGTRYLYAVTDVFNQVLEFRGGIASEGNNTTAAVPVLLEPLHADLRVEVVTVPATAQSGDAIDLSWRVVNAGTIATNPASWVDRIYLSADDVYDSGDMLLGSFTRNGALGPGANYTMQIALTLPNGIAGNYHVFVRTDAGNAIYESVDEGNNTGRSLAPILVTLKPSPDLQVLDMAGPLAGQTGQSVSVSWTVTNAGNGGATGPWVDSLYISSTGSVAGGTLLATVPRTALAVGGSYTASAEVVIPSLADGDYRFVLVTDATNVVYEHNAESNNVLVSAPIRIGHADLTITTFTVPLSATSGDLIAIDWITANIGTAPALGSWIDRVYLSSDTVVDAGDALLGSVVRTGSLAAGSSVSGHLDAVIPIDRSGALYLIVRADDGNQIVERNAEGNNIAVAGFTVSLAPYADLAVSNVTSPTLLIADPARITVGWTVSNIGTGAGQTSQWTDSVVLSRNEIAGDFDDIVIGRFTRDSSLAAGGSYSRIETMFAPAAISGRFNVFVIADADRLVFENNLKANNAGSSGTPLDLMPIPYADLKLVDVTVPASAQSGNLLEVMWTVRNEGIGRTDRTSWSDQVTVARNPDGSDVIVSTSFDHIGVLEVGGSYQRSGSVLLPNTLSGPVYVKVRTGGVFEFIYDDALNSRSAGPIQVSQSPAPDLVVTAISAPTAANEGATIDITWTVRNIGQARAADAWTDSISLRVPGLDPADPATPRPIVLGSFTYSNGLDAGIEYTRTERFQLPARIEGGWQVVVSTDVGDRLYEGSPEPANNTTASSAVLLLSLKPRPDLQVESMIAPERVTAGSTAAVGFTVVNRGSVATTTPRWIDRVYLSLDDKPGSDDILLATLDSGAALGPLEAYASTTTSVVIPERFRGPGFFLVVTDAGNAVDEYPVANENNNYLVKAVYVDAQPLADLVTGTVVAPAQAVYGGEITVRFTVTNNGSATTNSTGWTDTVWLTKDKTRPSPGPRSVLSPEGTPIVIPGNDAIFLGSFGHSGALAVGESYLQEVKVRIPQQIESGTYYITAWADAYDAVFEDSLAINVNPDDPTTLDSSNFKARAISILGTPVPPLPDLQVVQVTTNTTPDNAASVDRPLTVTWTVRNLGEGKAVGVGESWFDSVYLHDTPGLFDPGAKVWSLGSFERVRALDSLASYTQTKTFDLSPAARGLYVTVIADTNPLVPYVIESDETNNVRTAAANVVARPADLVVTSVSAPAQNFSGEQTTVTWTVQNDGASVWGGTRHWVDAIWISPDPVFGNRARQVGTLVHAAGAGLANGESYTASTQITVPAGFEGPYFLYVVTDVGLQALSPEAQGGENDRSRGFYGGSVYEDLASTNNLGRGTIDIIYREPDLTVSALTLPPGPLLSGQTVTVNFTVTNEGTRATREWAWVDRLYLSRDPSLDRTDLQVASFLRYGPLAAGASYERSATFQIPGDAEGRFYLIAFTDSNVIGAEPGSSAAIIGLSAIGIGNDAVPEFKDEGNNTAVLPVDVILAPAPDLRVTSIAVPERTLRGQTLAVEYTVSNLGGADTPGGDVSWFDRVYLSADALFDPVADRYLGQVEHRGVVAAINGSYTVQAEFRLPRELTGPYYVFVQTDPATSAQEPRGKVFEASNEGNNVTVSSTPVLIELPPPSDLVVDSISVPANGSTGEQVQITFTVSNKAGATAEGAWTDALYLSADSEWGLNDILLGKVTRSGALVVGESYTSQLLATLPPAKAGAYRIIVRTDIFNEVFEGEAAAAGERNNTTASASALTLTVPALQLGVPLQTTLSPGQQRLFKVTVGANETLSIALDAVDNLSTNELFVRYGDVASGFAYDFGALQVLSADPGTLVPTTQPGDYYVLIQGRSGAANNAPVKLTAKALPFSITDIVQDQGGDGRWVTTTITGARFKPGAVVKLVRPGLMEVEPASYQVIDATKIVATFDFRNVPHGLYDVAVINPDGAIATLPYRYLIEDALPIDVTIGLGGPRVVPAGQTGLYSISLQSLTNVDTPYVHFTFGAPELGDNAKVFGLPYLTFTTNVRGAPDGQRSDVPWVSLDSEVNSGGFMLAPGYALDVSAGGYVGMNFSVTTYPGLKALYDRDFVAYRNALYDARPDLAKQGVLDGGVGSLTAGLAAYFSDPTVKLNDDCVALFMPFLFNVTAAATPMTRAEFVAEQTREAQRLRSAVLADPSANGALVNLASDAQAWVNSYLGALEESGLLRPEDQAPPIRQDPKVVSMLAVLGSGVLVGPAGKQIAGPATLTAFFEQVHKWYGDAPKTIAPLIGYDVRISDICGEYGIPVPAIASFADFNLALSHPTYFQSVNVFSPGRGAGAALSVDPGFSSLASSNTLTALDLQALFDQIAQSAASGASISGPSGYGSAQFVPANTALPYTVRFRNPAESTTTANEVRIVSVLDDDLSVRSFRLGDMEIGGIKVNVPDGRANFQGDFDLRNSLGFILRVSAGVDPTSRTASWVLQAIDPETGEVLQDATRGLLQPDNTQGRGAGFVSYTVQAAFGAANGAEITAQARVLLDNQAPFETSIVRSTLDNGAPETTLTAALLQAGSGDWLVKWQAADEPAGSGVRHTTVYVRAEGGAWAIWQRQTTETQAVYEGVAGVRYEFLALSVDNAGNRELPPGNDVPSDGTVVDVGGTPDVGRTTQDVGVPPAPSNANSTNPLFLQAQANLPAAVPSNPSLFTTVVAPFSGEAFGTGIGQSFSGIGPLALLERPDGNFVVSGGGNRGALYVFDQDGGRALAPTVELDSPVFDFAWDGNDGLWATSGGGQLLELDPTTLQVINRYGDSLTQSLAFDAAKGVFFVSSGNGIERFDPVTRRFSHFSNVRVDDLAIAPDGSLWGTTWPKRGDIVSFDSRGRAQVQVRIDAALDSIAFGRAGTALEGLLFVSARIPSGSTDKASLYMVDLATLRVLEVARGGPSAEQLLATDDGRLLVSNGTQVDVLAPLSAPSVIAVGPPDGALVPLPLGEISVRFDSDMAINSVTDKGNYALNRDGINVAITQVRYDSEIRTAFLRFDALDPGLVELTVKGSVTSRAGLTLGSPFISEFLAVSDFSASVRIDFAATRSDRLHGTISYDVKVTNTTDYDLLAPLVLVLDPARFFAGLPAGAAVQSTSGLWLIDLSLAATRLAPGASTTVQTVTIQNQLNQRADFGYGIYALPYPNTAPVLDSVPETVARVGEAYRYDAHATDADGAVTAYILLSAPAGMQIDSTTGVVTWLPQAGTPAQASAVVRAYDARGGSATQAFAIDVVGGNRAPAMDQLPAVINLREGRSFSLFINSYDPDGEAVSYFADRLPPGATFDSKRAMFEWTPGFDQAGEYGDVRFYVSDGTNTVSRSVKFVVDSVSATPQVHGIPDRTVRQGDPIRFTVRADDADGDPLSFSAMELPAGAFLNPNTGVFEWSPAFYQAGDFTIRFFASDGTTFGERATTIHVTNVNAAPVFDPFERVSVIENEALGLSIFAFDPDNPGFQPQVRVADGTLTTLEGSPPSVVYAAVDLPTGAVFDTATGLLRWTPGYDQAGTYVLHFTATDDGDATGTPLTTTLAIPIEVRNANRPPVVAEINNVSVSKGQVLDIPIAVTDADGNSLDLGFDVTLKGILQDVAFNGLPLRADGRAPLFDFIPAGNGAGVLRVAPLERDRGDYIVSLVARDDGDGGGAKAVLSATRTFVVKVVSDAEPPLLAPIGPKVALIDQPLQFTLNASDLDQDALQFSAQNLPAGATLVPGVVYGTAVFSWTPSAADADTRSVTFTVTDSAGGSDSRTIDLIARATNAAPVLLPVGNRSVAENDLLEIQLAAIDADGDTLTYSASNLPPGAVFDAINGRLLWQTNYFSAGIYRDLVLSVSDGAATSSETIAITVTQTNQAPLFSLLPPLGTQEQRLLQFTLVATDPDGDGLIYSPLSALPRGAEFDGSNGRFTWIPGYDQAGEYPLEFAVRDPGGAQDRVSVRVSVADVNRVPVLAFTNHLVALGDTLRFTASGSDPDSGETLRFAARGMPEGASFNAITGEFAWTPGPGQVGDSLVVISLSDGKSVVERGLALRVNAQAVGPAVTIVQTPSFPSVPGQPVAITVLADAFSAVAGRTLTINGAPLTLDANGRVVFTAPASGIYQLVATATDLDGYTGSTVQQLRVRDPLDRSAPVVSLDAALGGQRISAAVSVQGNVQDSNLERWTLAIARAGSEHFVTLAEGSGIVTGTLATLDPARFDLGFYRLRLSATDIAGRSAEATTELELASPDSSARYQVAVTDFTAILAGKTLDFTRRYDSFGAAEESSFGSGWKLVWRDLRVDSDVPLTGSEATGSFNPFRKGSRVIVDTPDGERAAFTFEPERVSGPGFEYYLPKWVADDGNEWRLESKQLKLQRGAGRFYVLDTAAPYNPASMFGEREQFTLVKVDGTRFDIDTARGVTGITYADGTHFDVSDSGITARGNESIRFKFDTSGRISSVTAPDGRMFSYAYDASGNLQSMRDLGAGTSARYGYGGQDGHRLAFFSGPGGGQVIDYGASVATRPIAADLGGALNFLSSDFNGSLVAGVTDSYILAIRPSEVELPQGGALIIGVVVEATSGTLAPAMPVIDGLTPIASRVESGRAFALYRIDEAALRILNVTGVSGGSYRLSLFAAGDANRDTRVDGLDADLVAIARGSQAGDAAYTSTADFNTDGRIDAADSQLLYANLGFAPNQGPRVLPGSAFTHVELETAINVSAFLDDPEGDPLTFRILSAEHGAGRISADGARVIFTPDAGFHGQASFTIIADDGFTASAAGSITVQVSDSPLIDLDFVERQPVVGIGGSRELVFIGDFADQAGVLLPGSYLTLTSTHPLSGRIGPDGRLSGLSAGYGAITAERDGILAATAFMVGAPHDFIDAALMIGGLGVFPSAVTVLPNGGARQILVTSVGDDVAAAAAGTLYYASNGDFITITADGRIVGHDPGEAIVTVIHKMAEARIAVKVEAAREGAVTVGSDGGAVAGDGGQVVTIAPGALAQPAVVEIRSADPSTFGIALPPADLGYAFAAAFTLDTNGISLNVPAQLAIPTPGLAEGTTVLFYRVVDVPQPGGTIVRGWMEVESGIVDATGVARTTSPPYRGVLDGGDYIAVGMDRAKLNQIRVNVAAVTALSTAGIAVAPLIMCASPLLGGMLMLGSAIASEFIMTLPYGVRPIVIWAFNPVGGLTEVRGEAEVLTTGVGTFSARINMVFDPENVAPQVTSLQASFQSINGQPPEPLLEIKGYRLSYSVPGTPVLAGRQVGTVPDDIRVVFKAGDRELGSAPIVGTVTQDATGLQTLLVRVPNSIAIGSAYVEVRRQTPLLTTTTGGAPLWNLNNYLSSHSERLESDGIYAFAALGGQDAVAAISTVSGPGTTANEVIARIRVGDPQTPRLDANGNIVVDGNGNVVYDIGNFDGPRAIALTSDNARAYVALRSGHGVAVIDTLMLQQLDTRPDVAGQPDTLGVNFIKLPADARPFSIAIDDRQQLAFIGDEANPPATTGRIYVIDINPPPPPTTSSSARFTPTTARRSTRPSACAA